MTYSLGLAYLVSMFALGAVVAVVYTVAQEPFAGARHMTRHSLRRYGKLMGVLLALAVVVYFLTKI